MRGDAELITGARDGEAEAYAELYRRHRTPALRLARSLAGPSTDAEDLVADAFARVLAALRNGNGPAEAFRPYLLSAVRNAFYDHARRTAREQPIFELTPLAPEIPFVDPVMAEDESRLIATAFGRLPERWQVVLWHTEVEGEKPAEVARLLGISANAVAALAYRAREGLRERYLQAHVRSATDEQCRPTVARLGAYMRRKLSDAEREKVQAHLDGCGRCRLLVVELADVNSRLGTLLGPVVLGGAATAYLASGGASAAGVAAATTGVWSALGRLAQHSAAQVGAGAATAAGVIALALAFISEPVPNGSAAEPTAPPPVAAPTVRPPASASPTVAPPSATGSAAPVPELTATLEPVGPLVRGRPGLLLLTVTNWLTPGGGATVEITAAISLPAGVTLQGPSAGNGWTCSSEETLVTCSRSDLRAGETTQANLHVSVAVDAADGVPSVRVSGPYSPPVNAAASEGVVSDGRGSPQGP